MEKKDPIEEKFAASFGDFEAPPPEVAWDHIRDELHPAVPTAGWGNHLPFSLFLHKPLGFYIGLTGISFALLISVVWFLPGKRYDLRGHAYAGTLRMTQGTATLFRSSDQALPWDSLRYQRSALVDRYGHFRFANIPQGVYLLRLTPDPLSDAAQTYLPTWYDRCEFSDSCRRIFLKEGDMTLDVYLKRRE